MFTRLPRFERVAEKVHPIQITPRDLEIIRLVTKHRFLRSTQLAALISGSSQQLLRRLQLLFHHGYLERPRAQLNYYHRIGSQPVVYGLGRKGFALLNQINGDAPANVNPYVQHLHLEHTLLTAEVMVALERSCQAHRLPLIRQEDLNPVPFRWTVSLKGKRHGVIPDAVFALGDAGRGTQCTYFLEADRGTMPVTRRGIDQTCVYRKLLAYEATWHQGIHRTRFGIQRFRVLTVTTSLARLKRIRQASKNLKRGHGLFLFTDRESLSKSDFLSHEWQTAREETERLGDSHFEGRRCDFFLSDQEKRSA